MLWLSKGNPDLIILDREMPNLGGIKFLRALRGSGMYKDIPVIGPDGPIDNELRFDDEPVRHKLADLIGDLTLAGRPLSGRIVACRSGHSLNHALCSHVGC